MTKPSTNAAFTGSIPANYDTYLGPLLFEFSAADTARRVAAALDGPTRVLEVACGTGISTRHLAAALPPGSQIIATDLNQAMLDHAGKVNGNLPGVTYAQADALDLPFGDADFDAVVCQFGIMFFPDKAKGMAEMARVLRPGGMLALNVWDSFAENPSVAIVAGVIKGFFDTDPPRFLEVPFSLHDVAEGRKLFHDAGFAEVEATHVSAHVPTSDYNHLASGAVIGTPNIIEIEQRTTVGADQVIAAAAAALEQAYGPAPAKLRFQEIVYIARKPAA